MHRKSTSERLPNAVNRHQDHPDHLPRPSDGLPRPADTPNGLPRPKRRLPPQVLTDDEVRALIEALPPTTTGLRNRALLTILYRAGLRIAEALALLPGDVDWNSGTILVAEAKGGRPRIAGIDAGAAGTVRAWEERRARLGRGPNEPLLCTVWGTRLTTAYVRRLLPQLAMKAGVLKRVHAHGFRHTHASQLRREGLDIGIISKQLGHQSIVTTAIYLDHIDPAAMINAIRSRAWKGSAT